MSVTFHTCGIMKTYVDVNLCVFADIDIKCILTCNNLGIWEQGKHTVGFWTSQLKVPINGANSHRNIENFQQNS